jgi:predicted negative regulator of RcsB-dependent stress response
MYNSLKTIIQNKKVIIVILLIVIGIFSLRFFNSAGTDSTEEKAILYYIENFETNADSRDITAQFVDFGCHSEIHIFENEELAVRFNYQFGRFFKIG